MISDSLRSGSMDLIRSVTSGKIFVKVRDRVVLVNNVTALNKLASEIGRDAIKVINDINTKSPRSSQGLTRVRYTNDLYYTIQIFGYA
jgi:hypothetical protein